MIKSRPAIDDDTLQGPSKTQLKQQMLELQQLGQALAELPGERLKASICPIACSKPSSSSSARDRTKAGDARCNTWAS